MGGLALAVSALGAGCGGRLLPLVGSARRPVVGFVGLGASPLTGQNANFEAFVAGLRELGWADGESLTLHSRFAEGRAERIPELVGELIGLPVELLVSSGAAGAIEAAKLTSTIPIVFASAADPIEQGLVCNLARPCGNVTGLSNLGEGLDGKRVELLREAVPGLARLAVLWHQPTMLPDFRRTEAAAQVTGVRLLSMGVADPAEIPAAFEAAVGAGAQALVTIGNGLTAGARDRIVELAIAHRLPTMFHSREFVDAGGLLTYGPNQVDQHRRSANYAHRILKGARPADLPVEQPTTFDFIVNLKAAGALGLTLPQSLLQQATEVLR